MCIRDRILQSKLDFYVHFAEVGTDLDKRNYEVCYDRIGKTGFNTSIDINRGIDELVSGLQHLKIRRPHSNV